MPNVIGDVAGQFKTLMTLIEKMPSNDIILVGDLIDRGPESNKVVEFARTTPNVKALYGNHEEMMIDYFDQTHQYDEGLWVFQNGGKPTLNSYGYDEEGNPKVPKEHLDFLRSLPLYIETDKFFISHSFWHSFLSLEAACNPTCAEWSIVWNRMPPKRRDKFQIAGHNSQFGLKKFDDFAICIDTSASDILTGINTDTMEIFQQPYL